MMNGFLVMESQLIKVEVEENTNFHCIVCNAEFLSRSERNEHLETHFVHRNCKNCSRQVIVIGDLEFELHQPTHCKPNESRDDGTCELIDIYEPEDDHLSDDGSSQQLIDSKPFGEQQEENFGNFPQRSIKLESNRIGKLEPSECVMTSKEKLLKPHCERKMLKRNVKRKCIRTGNNSQPKMEVVRADERRQAANSDDDLVKEMDVAMRKRQRKYRRLPKTVPCTMCDAMVGSERTLKIHLNQVHGIKERYICPVCSREFKISGNLKQHIETHSDYKRYVCDWCGKGFHLPYNLKEHMNTHTGARPYKCETCGKTFGRNTLRQAHMRIHTGEKPYKCTEQNCDRAYAYQTDLKRHKRSVHNIITKTFPCPICSKVFYENKFLTKHLNVHQGNT